MPSHPETPGGQGEEPSRSDLRLQAQALRADWPMGPGVRTSILRRALKLATGRRHEDRVKVAALRVLLAADALNVRQQALDLRREELELRRREAEGPGEDDEDFTLDLRTGPADDADDSD